MTNKTEKQDLGEKVEAINRLLAAGRICEGVETAKAYNGDIRVRQGLAKTEDNLKDETGIDKSLGTVVDAVGGGEIGKAITKALREKLAERAEPERKRLGLIPHVRYDISEKVYDILSGVYTRSLDQATVEEGLKKCASPLALDIGSACKRFYDGYRTATIEGQTRQFYKLVEDLAGIIGEYVGNKGAIVIPKCKKKLVHFQVLGVPAKLALNDESVVYAQILEVNDVKVRVRPITESAYGHDGLHKGAEYVLDTSQIKGARFVPKGEELDHQLDE
ncbi:hypothetical protein HZB90_03670 [archaeon]|nr:hypothetical protein [archaeon]